MSLCFSKKSGCRGGLRSELVVKRWRTVGETASGRLISLYTPHRLSFPLGQLLTPGCLKGSVPSYVVLAG